MRALTSRRGPVAVLFSLTALVVAGVAGGCGSCQALEACSASHLSYSGELVDRATGAHVRGGTISFVRDSGATMVPDSIATGVDGDGFFRLSASAEPPGGWVWGTLIVNAPAPFHRYAIPNMPLQVRSIYGDGGQLARIAARPYIYEFMALRKPDGATPIANAHVAIRRTGGIQVASMDASVTSDPYGNFIFTAVPADGEYGPLNADFVISGGGLSDSVTVPMQIRSRYQDLLVHDVNVLLIAGR